MPSYKIYEDKMFFVFLDIRPVNLGHALIAPKEHYRNLFDMPDKLMRQLGPVLKKIARAVFESTRADGLNIGWNNEPAGGQLIFHAHVHVMPRFTNDSYRHWHGKEGITPQDFTNIAEQIRSAIK